MPFVLGVVAGIIATVVGGLILDYIISANKGRSPEPIVVATNPKKCIAIGNTAFMRTATRCAKEK